MTAWTDSDQQGEPPAYDGPGAALPNSVTVQLATRPLGDGSAQVLVTLKPPLEPQTDKQDTSKAPTRRAPVDIVCVIDVSSSMNEPATLPAEPGARAC